MIIQDTHARQEALDITQSFIVQAPAGSGKTELLTQRYLNLLAHAQKAPEEIIAITFTRKAAAEMRERIIKALLFAQKPEPEKDDYRFTTWLLATKVLQRDTQLSWDILHNPNRLRILTIDALSAFICKQTPTLNDFGGLFSVSDNAQPLYQLAATRALTEIFIEEQWQKPLEQLLLHLDNRVDTLEALLADLLSKRDQWLPHILHCYQNHHTIRESLEKNLARLAVERMQAAANAMPESLRQMLVLCARHAGAYFVENDINNPVAACADFTWKAKPLLSEFKHWIGLGTLLLTKELSLRKTVTVSNGFSTLDPNKSLMLEILHELQNHSTFLNCMQDILICPPIAYTESQWKTLETLTQLLPLLAAQLSLVFQEKKQIDFVELNLSALKALGETESPTDLTLYLDYQIRHLLIDEFQDTSITHLHLLEKIIAGWQADDGRTLFVVGDPMQSIYRFRNAEVGLFLRAQEQGIGTVALEPLTLTTNFRSQATLIDWFNTTFNAIFPTMSDVATGRVPYTPAIAARNATSHKVTLHPLISSNDVNEARCVVDAIQNIKKENQNDSIAILVRSRSQLTDIIALLHAEKLPFQAIDIEPLYDRLEIQDLLSLTRALLHRMDRIAWLAILRAPFCGLTLADLESVAKAAEKSTIWEALNRDQGSEIEDQYASTDPQSPIPCLSADGLSRIQRLRYFLQHAFASQSHHALSAWIEGTWIALGGPACLSNITELNNTRAYFNLLEKLDNDKALSIDQLIEHCKKLYANSHSPDHNAIQIMTIHKSKGLEFDHVFLPGLNKDKRSDEAQLLQWCDRPSIFGGDDLLLAPIKPASQESDAIYDGLKKIEDEKQRYEMTRVFYVAATRAKKSLQLFFQLDWDEKKSAVKKPGKSSFLAILWPVIEPTLVIQPPNSTVEETVTTEKKSQPHSRLSSNWQLPSIHDNKSITLSEQIIDDKVPVKIDITLHDTQAQIIGTMIHEIIQMIANNENKIDLDMLPVPQWQARLAMLGILPHALPTALDTVKTAITTMLQDTRGQWILSQQHDAHSEWAFSQYSDNDFQHSVIDRSFIDENGTRWIIDYKTSKPNENESMDAFLKRQKTDYKKQLQNYADILSQKENRPIKLGLYFPMCKKWIEWGY